MADGHCLGTKQVRESAAKSHKNTFSSSQ